MQITINIKDSSKAKVYLDFIKSLDYISLKKIDNDIDYPSMSKEEIIDRVTISNQQIKKRETILQDDLLKEAQNW